MVRRLLFAGLVLAGLTGCFAPKAEEAVRGWRPLGPGGPTLAEALAVSPRAKGVVWETDDGEAGAAVVRVSAEYDPSGPAGSCPAPAPGLRPAARVFLLLDFAVSPAGAVTFVAARAQTYSAKGHVEDFPLDIGVVADLVARTFPLPCADLVLPEYL